MKYAINEQKEYITKFVDSLRNVKKKEELENMWNSELINIYKQNAVKEKQNENYYKTDFGFVNVKTITKEVTLYRSLIRSKYEGKRGYKKRVDLMLYNGAYIMIENEHGKLVRNIKHSKRGIINVPDEVKIFDSKNTKALLKERKNNKTIIKDVDGMYERLGRLFDSSNWYDLVIYLTLVTGRRSTEILQTGNFTRCKGNDYNAWFTGQIKTRNDKFVNVKYKIPLLDTFANVKEAINFLRSRERVKKLSGKTREAVNKATSKQVNNKVKKYFYDNCKEIKLHTLRAVYAILCTQNLKPSGVFATEFVSQILGHDLGETSTSSTPSQLYQLYDIESNLNFDISYTYIKK